MATAFCVGLGSFVVTNTAKPAEADCPFVAVSPSPGPTPAFACAITVIGGVTGPSGVSATTNPVLVAQPAGGYFNNFLADPQTFIQARIAPSGAGLQGGGLLEGLQGTTGALYTAPVMDYSNITTVSSAATYTVATGVTGENIFLYGLAYQANGTESGVTVSPEEGTGTNCNTNTQALFTAPLAGGTTAGQMTTLYAGNSLAATASSFSPAANPFVVKPGYSLCIVVTGTTINGYAIMEGSIH